MFVIEVYKLGEFLGYSNGTWDYDDNNEEYPYVIPDMDFNRLFPYTEETAKRDCERLQNEFFMYDFVVKELD